MRRPISLYKTEDFGRLRQMGVGLQLRCQQDISTAIRVTLLLGVCYAANIGGTGTLIGTPANLVSVAMIQKLYPGSDEITFATWMMYNLPGVFLCVIFGWIYLWLVNIYLRKVNHNNESKDQLYGIISTRYERLGSLSKVGDSAVAIAIVFLMFFLPSDFRDLNSPPILEWKAVQAKFPWAVIFLVGGASSLAHGAQVSGLSNSIGSMLSSVRALPPGLVVAITCFSTALATECFTNITVTMIFLPIVNQMALSIGMNPLYLMLPTTVVSSYGFMLPVASICNAIVYEEGNLKMMDMLKPGIAMNIICCCVQLVTLHTLGVALFDLNKFPSWADDRNITNFAHMAINGTLIQNDTLTL
ncbi:Solute carrier family 13 member 5 [Araneus ventricosus]|uniref:Solute carrier family 13 member 5 n=1 Tax=Araneus ventricosus TaxID=182803 RepID=A0A4Y2NG68_ARAVE|nr:Solute carrier family 13 member 5 [Araneus ventricosus]